jgi:hypothetical protein
MVCWFCVCMVTVLLDAGWKVGDEDPQDFRYVTWCMLGLCTEVV